MRKIVIRTQRPLEFRWFVFDLETRGLNAKNFKFVGVKFKPSAEEEPVYRYFTSIDEFWAWAETFKQRTYAYAYRATYDLCGLMQNPQYDLSNFFEAGGRFISGRHGQVAFADAANLLHSVQSRELGLAEIGKRYGLPKMEMPASLKDEDNYEITQEEIDYNKRDLDVLWLGLETFFQFVGKYAPPRPLTLAANSLRIWQEKFCPIAGPHVRGLEILVSDHDDMFAHAYYGGRTEVYKRGELENLDVYDVHSMYPSVMQRAFPVPALLTWRTSKHLNQGEFLKVIEEGEGMAHGIATVPPGLMYGPLPLRSNGKVIFPTGTFKGCWCFPEIRNLLALGGKFKFVEAWFSRERCYPFKDFVQEFYALRQASDGDWEDVQNKMLMNALYGKLSQQQEPQRIYQRTPVPLTRKDKDDWTWQEYFPGEPGAEGFWERELPVFPSEDGSRFTGPAYHAIICFAAYTTSYARTEHLQGLMRTDAVYGDTDSAFTQGAFPSDLISTDAGGWVQKTHLDKARFFTPKTYVTQTNGQTIFKCKGIPRKELPGLFAFLYERNFEYLRDEKEKFGYQRLRTPHEAAVTRTQPGTPHWVSKNLRLDDTKRCWTGVDSSPHRYDIVRGSNIQVCKCC